MTSRELTPRGTMRPEPSLFRSSRTMAFGTIASRATGFLRTAVIAAALGSGLLGDAYNVANTTPNILYELLLGGVLTSVVVPLLVQAAHDDGDDGEAFGQRLLTLVLLGLGSVSVLAVLAAPWIIDLYAGGFTDSQHSLATTFARFFLPQIVFYGLGATFGAILNTRNRFAAPMWAPVLNNLVVIATGLLFLAVVHTDAEPDELSQAGTLLLAIGTTAGIVAQTFALIPSLRAARFRLRLRFDLRHTGLGRAGRLGGWVLLYVAANQVGFLVIVRLATAAARTSENGVATGFSPYVYAFLLVQLPHAIVAVSIITALLPRMSRHAADDRRDLVRSDLSTGLRLTAAVLVPAALGLVVLGREVAVLVLGHGNTSAADARYIGVVLAGFAVGLVPFSFFQLQLRAFYALQDTRTPALLNIWVNVANIAVDLALYAVLPQRLKVVGLALGYSASYAVGLALMSRSLRGRLDGLDGRRVVQTVARLAAAGLPALLVAAVLAGVCTRALGFGNLGSLVALLVGGGAGLAVFVAVAARLRVAEVAELTARLSAAASGTFARLRSH